MSRNRKTVKECKERNLLETAIYIRLSKEDEGDKSESDSVINQRIFIMDYIKNHKDLIFYNCYIDDGYTGTNFNRPAFKQLIRDIEENIIQCVVVKDLSRLGRNHIQTGYYIEEYFPNHNIRFISINDNIDKDYNFDSNQDDIMLPMRNVINELYSKDISKKVKSAIKTKQRTGQFIGAFASYGYKKDSKDKNKLEIDEYASFVVKRIFQMFIDGKGKQAIAKQLNDEGILCPSMYKKHNGLNYHNGNRLEQTSYWTYSTICRILENEVYIGHMVQNRSYRRMRGKAKVLPKEQWIVVENTHEAIIDMETWERAQNILRRKTKQMNLDQNVHIFAGFIECGDCGRAMVKIKRSTGIWYNCGSFNRYGNTVCFSHNISYDELEKIILNDLNIMIKSIKNLKKIVLEEQEKELQREKEHFDDKAKYELELEKCRRKKRRAYVDYNEEIITKEEYLMFKKKCEEQEVVIKNKISLFYINIKNINFQSNPWIEKLLEINAVEHLDRGIVADMIDMIYIYNNKTIKIVYNFSDELETLLTEFEAGNMGGIP